MKELDMLSKYKKFLKIIVIIYNSVLSVIQSQQKIQSVGKFGLFQKIIFGGDSQRVRASFQCNSGAREAASSLVGFSGGSSGTAVNIYHNLERIYVIFRTYVRKSLIQAPKLLLLKIYKTILQNSLVLKAFVVQFEQYFQCVSKW